jgi:hypothetical protein
MTRSGSSCVEPTRRTRQPHNNCNLPSRSVPINPGGRKLRGSSWACWSGHGPNFGRTIPKELSCCAFAKQTSHRKPPYQNCLGSKEYRWEPEVSHAQSGYVTSSLPPTLKQSPIIYSILGNLGTRNDVLDLSQFPLAHENLAGISRTFEQTPCAGIPCGLVNAQ